MGSTSIVTEENVYTPYFEAHSGRVFDKFQHPACKKLEIYAFIRLESILKQMVNA